MVIVGFRRRTSALVIVRGIVLQRLGLDLICQQADYFFRRRVAVMAPSLFAPFTWTLPPLRG